MNSNELNWSLIFCYDFDFWRKIQTKKVAWFKSQIVPLEYFYDFSAKSLPIKTIKFHLVQFPAPSCKVRNRSDILKNMEQSGDSCEVSTALKSIDLNSTKENALISTEEKTGCFLCQNPDPIKKCSKSHSRCKGKLFCNKNCELSFHKSEKAKVSIFF